jgi:hypothetical protein
MCNVRAPLFLLLLAPALSAQDSVLAKLHRRADSLAQEWRQANAIADLADSLEHERAVTGRDTIAVGALRIIANPSPLPLREAAARAWPVIDSFYGTAAQDLTQRPYIIKAFDPDTTVPRPRLHVGMSLPWNTGQESLTLLLISTVPVTPPDSALQNWLGGPVRPSVREQRDRAGVYVQLVTAPSQAARSCFQGRLESCTVALGLGTTTLEAWYPSAAERRSLVIVSFTDYFDHGGTAAAYRTCAGGSDSACTGLLRTLPKGSLPRPLGADARVTLVYVALHLGGREAYHRLLATPDVPIRARLAAAAGVSEDSLLARWRAEIIAAHPRAVALPPWAFFFALGWVVVFAGCGLRSSRWRLG